MKNPKEEAKQRAKNYMRLKGALDSQYVDFSNPNADKITSASTTTIQEEPKQIKCYCGHTTYCDCSPIEEPRKETLEEAAERIYPTPNPYIMGIDLGNSMRREAFKEGAKWEQEISYIEANKIIEFLDNEAKLKISDTKTIERIKWYFETYFEQFKKK